MGDKTVIHFQRDTSLQPLLSAKTTNGTFSLSERFLPPNSTCTNTQPLLIVYILEGHLTSPVADQGDILCLPAGASYTSGQESAKVLEIVFFTASKACAQVKKDEGRFLSVLTDIGAIKLSEPAFLLMEWAVPPAGGVALHAQGGMETFYVVHGQFLFRGRDDELHAGPGDVVHVPERVPHAYHNQGNNDGRMLVLTVPAGKTVQFFEEIGTPVAHFTAFPASLQVPDPEVLQDLLQRYQVDVFFD